MIKVNKKKYYSKIKEEFKFELVKRSPSATYTYILIGIVVGLTSYGATELKTAISIFGYLGTAASLTRLYTSRKILKQPGLIYSKWFPIHNFTIFFNAICWCAIYSLISWGTRPDTLAFAMAFCVTLSICMGGISSLTPHPRLQSFFFITNTLIPTAVILYRNYINGLLAQFYIFPLMIVFAFIYVFTQSKRFYANLFQTHYSELLLKDERDHLQSVIDTIPGFLIYLNSNLEITSVTKNLAEMLGDAFKEGVNLGQTANPLRELIREFIHSTQTYDTKELCLKTKKGDEWFLLSFNQTDHAENIIVVGAPVSELVKTREELAERSLKAVNASKLAALGELAAGAAHEINNPVAIIHGYITEMKRMLTKTEFDAKLTMNEKLDRSAKTLLRIKKIVSGLRLLSRDAEEDPFNMSSLSMIVDDTLSLCQDKFADSKIKLALEPVPEIQFECNPTQVSQVLLNLINNAFDAVNSIPDKSDKEVRVKFIAEKNNFKVIVKDNGPGVAPEAMARVFEPFYTTKDPGKGTGLGLSISKSIMDTHKGKISFVNNHGAEFTLQFPYRLSQDAAPSSSASA